MTNTASKDNKLKMAVIPVLGLVLLYVVMGGEDTTAAPTIELVSRPGAGSGPHGSSTDRRHSNPRVSWPERSLHTIIGHNPLELTDPRAILDAEYLKYGITEVTQMTAVDATEFFEDFAGLAGADGNSAPSVAGTLSSTGRHARDSANSISESAEDIAAKARRARITALQQRIQKLQNTPVTMIMTTDRGRSALLGDRTITEGEVLEEGIRAVSIGRNGVTFEIVDNTKTQ